MKLYEINQEIENLVDEETGEITDISKFNELQIAKEEKLANVSLYVKNQESDIDAIKNEIDKLQERLRTKKNKVNNTKEWLSNAMLDNGIKKIETPNCVISFRKSKAVVVDDEEAFIKKHKGTDLVKEKVVTSIDKTALKNYLKDNLDEHARIEERQNIQIK